MTSCKILITQDWHGCDIQKRFDAHLVIVVHNDGSVEIKKNFLGAFKGFVSLDELIDLNLNEYRKDLIDG